MGVASQRDTRRSGATLRQEIGLSFLAPLFACVHTDAWSHTSPSIQTCIEAEGFRSLRPGEPVEFSVERGDDGQLRAIKVTGPQGVPPQVAGL